MKLVQRIIEWLNSKQESYLMQGVTFMIAVSFTLFLCILLISWLGLW